MKTPDPSPRILLAGHDTVACAYYLHRRADCLLDFEALMAKRDALRAAKVREPAVVALGADSFLLQPYGSSSGYPLVLDNERLRIECGPNNTPSFYVTYRSYALWSKGVWALHRSFLEWADQVGFIPARPESLSRVDCTFDVDVPEIDFDEDHLVTLSRKDVRYRQNRETENMQFGRDDIVLRLYNKVREIEEASDKRWFFDLWGQRENVWRIEWQVRKAVLKRFAIRTMQDLADQQGDLLRYLATDHDSLRRPTNDSNRARWPLHPIWTAVLETISTLDMTGIDRCLGDPLSLAEREIELTISVYGYLKRLAAIQVVRQQQDTPSLETTLQRLSRLAGTVHQPQAWNADVASKAQKMALGKW